MPWTPPKKTTVILTIILEVIGLILAFIGIFGVISPIESIDINLILNITGLLLSFIGWIILLLGILLRGF